jgi:filamentous hemagglutinin
MVLDTLGKEVDVVDLIKIIPPKDDGINSAEVAKLFKLEGVDAVALSRRNIDDLSRYTSNGVPVVVRIEDKSSQFSHFVVVDGVTSRQGVAVVAIRDPQGFQYFSPVSSFVKSFSGDVIYLKGR